MLCERTSTDFAGRYIRQPWIWLLLFFTVAGDPLHSGNATYTLDKVGNREARLSSIADLPSSTGHSFNGRDQLSTDTYDANGNTNNSELLAARYPLLATTSVPDVYDFEDRLIVRTRGDLSSVYVHYDADGIRIGKTVLNAAASLVSSTSYLVCTNNLTGYAQVLEERKTDVGGTTLKTYTYGHDLLSVTTVGSGTGVPPAGSETRYFLYDGGGSVRALADDDGTITDRYTYDAFGVLLTHVGTSDNAYLYRGEQWDADLGLYYLRARFLNPDSGRFWNQDTYEGRNTDPASLHKYLYAHADPVNGIDPSGHFTLTEVQAVMGNMMTLARMAQPVIRAYHYANSIIDMVNMVAGFAQLLQTGGLQQMLGDVTRDVASMRAGDFSPDEAAEAFVTNLAPHLHLAVTHWSPALMADLASGARFTGYSIFGPNMRGSNTSKGFSSGLTISGHPVHFVLGGVGSGRLAGIGIQTERGARRSTTCFTEWISTFLILVMVVAMRPPA